MRQIKFRGKRIDNGKWAYGFLYRDEDCELAILQEESEISDLDRKPQTIFVNHKIVEGTETEFTGLKDKNGKEIYEGDILKAIDVLLTVWYNDATASFDVLHYGDETGDTESLYSNIEADIPLEIIGNIYSNHELLNP